MVGVRHVPLGRFSTVDISTVGIVSVPKNVGFGSISPKAFRRRMVRYWHPLGCRAIELEKPPKGGVIYAVRRIWQLTRGVYSGTRPPPALALVFLALTSYECIVRNFAHTW